MATASVLIAAEERELKGLLGRVPHEPMAWPDAAFARVSGVRILLANGAGPRSVEQMSTLVSDQVYERIRNKVHQNAKAAGDPKIP